MKNETHNLWARMGASVTATEEQVSLLRDPDTVRATLLDLINAGKVALDGETYFPSFDGNNIVNGDGEGLTLIYKELHHLALRIPLPAVPVEASVAADTKTHNLWVRLGVSVMATEEQIPFLRDPETNHALLLKLIQDGEVSLDGETYFPELKENNVLNGDSEEVTFEYDDIHDLALAATHPDISVVVPQPVISAEALMTVLLLIREHFTPRPEEQTPVLVDSSWVLNTINDVLETGKTPVSEVNQDLMDAMSQLLDRLRHHGNIDLVREEGPIADAEAAFDAAKAMVKTLASLDAPAFPF